MVKQLFAALDGERASGVIRQPCRLVVRESTGPVASRGAARTVARTEAVTQGDRG
ncbi:hypothetical protein O7626_13360 [Micromonospora sp. WMMD1102]|uniref:hypothetical protein n=1 Tax=Micromonospora sp. WMMD1102 TaxID=3016105 RepID=UPI0024157718|nr:hypothetical protein [Micromonospora sp. WMMD1102]MDG4786907.1 hypothetical protein [Micromonospora sp. WMMD1102]